jgi:8-oxo-dGTP pyrophosphatase MutT (NUDIX family)
MKRQWLATLGPRIKPALFPVWLVIRGMTFGVRCAAFDDNGAVCLVKHTYTDGWHFPGGGVERGETMYQALVKEMREEAGIELRERAALFGVYANNTESARDHVVLFVTHNWQQRPLSLPTREIAELGFFDPAALPVDTTPATRRRIEELASDGTPDQYW